VAEIRKTNQAYYRNRRGKGMKAKYIVILCIVIVGVVATLRYVNTKGAEEQRRPAAVESGIASAPSNPDIPTGTAEVTFVELGSVNCIPCKQMQPIMDAIETEYAGKVRIVFHDVWTPGGREHGQRYGIRVIPTQVFLDRDGNEIGRHQGFFPKEQIEDLLAKHGVTK
jgi:thioredoxin 1